MTPLAAKIAKDHTLPINLRLMDDRHDLLSDFWDVHCFEMSEVWWSVKDIAQQEHDRSIGADGRYKPLVILPETTFLPAPKTWIEWTGDNPKDRQGVLLSEAGPLALCTLVLFFPAENVFRTQYQTAIVIRDFDEGTAGEMRISKDERGLNREHQINLLYDIHAALAFINTPKIIGRIQHTPHRGLEKKLGASLGMQERFHLHDWTEIKLKITPLDETSDDTHNGEHLTGKRALHFCRSHLRIRLGRLERVRAHWRGDASLGIKQSKYRIVH